MAHDLQLTVDDDYTGSLTLSRHPDGTLEFEDGVATVGDEALAHRIADRYPNIEYAGARGETSADGAAGSDDTIAEPPLDPTEYSVADLRDALADGDYGAAELDAIDAAERGADEPRSTALEAIDAARE